MKILKTTLLSTLFIAFSCNKAKETMQNTVTNVMENAIENQTGTRVDLPDAEDMDKNGGFVSYKSERKVYLNGKEKMQATVIFQKDNKDLSIAFQLTGEGGKSFIATLNHVPEDFVLPLKGKFTVGNQYDGKNPTGMIMYMDVSENGMMTSEIPYEGEITISELSKNTVEFEIEGKGSDASDIDSPSNWKAILGKGKIINPIILSQGIDKNNIINRKK